MKLRLSSVAVVSFIIFNGLSLLSSHKIKGPRKVVTCTKPACKEAAKDLKRFMDTTVNPCDDFYKFTCGKFLKESTIPDDKVEVSSISELQDKLDKNLKNILEKKKCIDCPLYETRLREYYQSCMDIDAIERDGEEAMLNLLNEFGGWPMVDDTWVESNADLTNIMTTLFRHSLANFFAVFVYVDEKNSSARAISMKQGIITFPKDHYTDENNDKIDAFKTLITNVVKDLSKGKAKPNETERYAEEIIALETSLSKISYTVEESSRLFQTKFTLGCLADKFKEVFNMTAIIEKIFGQVGIKIDRDESIFIYGTKYFEKLAKLLKETPKCTIINYLMWQVFDALSTAMPGKYQNHQIEFNKVVWNISEQIPRWQSCASLVKDMFTKPLGAAYAKTYLKKTAKDKVKKIIPRLKKSFEGMIINATWLTTDAKSSAIKKLNKTRDHVGYPDYYDTTKNLFEELFDKNDELESKSFLRNYLHYKAVVSDESFKLLKTPVDPNKGDMDVAVVDGTFYPPTNALIFSAGMLQKPYFAEHNPMYLNYGGIGFYIGICLIYGFDEYGHRFDETGNLHDWWKEEDKTNYAAASKCIAEMYSNFVVEELNVTVNGNLTIRINVADNGGIRAAFMAYQSWKNKNGEEPKLPDLDFTPEQLFFINYGRTLCEQTRTSALEWFMTESYHSPGHFRINGPLMNMEEFSEVFNCKPKSPMNPEKKCRVF